MTTIYFATNHATAVPIMQGAWRGEVAVPLGYIDTPNQGNRLPADVLWCADNGRFSCKDWTEAKWWHFLERKAYAADRCAFATAPDVVDMVPVVANPDPNNPRDYTPVGNAAATAEMSRPWIAPMKALGYRVAWVAQDGWDPDLVPWDEIDAIFIGGSDAFKLGEGGQQAARDAHKHGKWLHVGRVNSALRMDAVADLRPDSVDGSCLVKGAVKGGINLVLPKLLSWIGDEDTVTRTIAWAGLEKVAVDTKHGPERGLRLGHQSEYALAA